jgi:hypothetical protein
MSDPLTSGAGKIADEMLKEVASAMTEKPKEAPSVEFNQVIDAQRAPELNGIQPDASNVLRVAVNRQVDVPAVGQTLDTKPLMNGLHRILEDVMQGQNKLEEIINLSLSGRNFSSQELLALQAGVYRFTQELELTSKVVEKATSTIKQTMNTQV